MLMGVVALLSLGTGTLAGILGIGGGVILMPLLIWLGLSPIQAAATSSCTILFSSSYGTWSHSREKVDAHSDLEEGYLDLTLIIGIGIPLLITAYLCSAYWIHLLSPTHLKWGLTSTLGVILALVLRLHFKPFESSSTFTVASPKSAGSVKYTSYTKSQIPFMIALGGMGGSIAGFLGLGGGTIIVPFQLLFLKSTIKSAVKNSKALVALGALSATVGHLLSGHIQFKYVLITGGGMIVGMHIGGHILQKVSPERVRILYLILLSLLFVRSLYINIVSL